MFYIQKSLGLCHHKMVPLAPPGIEAEPEVFLNTLDVALKQTNKQTKSPFPALLHFFSLYACDPIFSTTKSESKHWYKQTLYDNTVKIMENDCADRFLVCTDDGQSCLLFWRGNHWQRIWKKSVMWMVGE